MRPSAQVAITAAAIAVGLGMYSEYRQVSEQLGLLTGLAGLIAIGAGVLWWSERLGKK